MKNIALIFNLLLMVFSSSFAQQLNQREITDTQYSAELDGAQLANYNHQPSIIHRNNTTSVLQTTIENSTNAPSSRDVLHVSLVTPNTDNNHNSNDLNTINPVVYWGNNGAQLRAAAYPITTDLSADISSEINTTVSYMPLQRIWKFVRVDDTVPNVRLQIPQHIIRNNGVPGHYYMLISDSDTFDSHVDFRIMTLNEAHNLETAYRFNRTSYITFGFSPQIIKERSIYFNGVDSYIDAKNTTDLNPNGFTLSAWIKHNAEDSGTMSILSKRDVPFTKGFDLTLTSAHKIQMTWKNNSNQLLTSYTSIPEQQWHHIAVTYNGTTVSIFIDGVLDSTAERTAPIETDASLYIAAAGNAVPSQHFKGYIDEVRIWNTCLTEKQLRFMMNQEIANDSGHVIGKETSNISKNDIQTLLWSDLAAYYPMRHFTFKNTIDASNHHHNGRLVRNLTVDKETVPLPYRSKEHGDWNNQTTWKNGTMQYIPGSASIVNPNTTIDWNIVKTTHNLSMDNLFLPTQNNQNRTVLALFVEANTLQLTGENSSSTGQGLTVSHYLKLQGKIDLEGESQLIQTLQSDLDVLHNGHIERDQQGTADTFTYNYWSSPVKQINSEMESFRIMDVLKDGTYSDNPEAINFSSSGYNGAPTHPITIADYWIWKYSNASNNSYSTWQHIRRTGSILPGEGFTMKGPGTGSVSTPQNYVFSGQPNNGDVNISVLPDNDYLVGNPYPSAIDALQFIKDNGPDVATNSPALISGTLYFWNHWAGGSHSIQEYDGGYATYNYSGSVAAAYKGNSLQLLESDGEPTKAPGRYIPVGQGFFVTGKHTGTLHFNNRQRVFKKEGQESVYMRNSNSTNSMATALEDLRMKFRIGFSSVNTIRRQLLLTIDENATPGIDWAYDGEMNEQQIDDMFWVINEDHYIIQASNETETTTRYPIGIKTNTNGINSIMIDALENVPSTIDIYLHDNELGIYHDLRNGSYDIFLLSGTYLNRFAITFGIQEDLSLEDHNLIGIDVLYANNIDSIVVINPNQHRINNMKVFNMLGQSVSTIPNIKTQRYTEYPIQNLSAGTYIVTLQTNTGTAITKKIIVD